MNGYRDPNGELEGHSWTGIPELKRSYQDLGPLKFWSWIAGALAMTGLGTWLSIRLDYPDAYGHPCHGRACILHNIWFSPALLRTHHWDEVLLFLLLITLPAALVMGACLSLIRVLRGKPFSLLSNDQE